MSDIEIVEEFKKERFEPVIEVDNIRFDIDYLNGFISCMLCKGYLVNASTILECFHSFCRECIEKHFNAKGSICPRCSTNLSPNSMKNSVARDSLLQNLVDSLVKKTIKKTSNHSKKVKKANLGSIRSHLNKNSNLVCFELRSYTPFKPLGEFINSPPKLLKPFLKVSPEISMRSLKKYIVSKISTAVSIEKVELFYKAEKLGNEWTVLFIQKTKWKNELEEDDFIEFAIKK